MFVGAHATVPVLLASLFDLAAVVRRRQPLFHVRELLAVGLAGILPDILSPHLSLHARLTSWSHTVWFLLVLYFLLIPATRLLYKKRWIIMTQALWFGVAIHLFMDLSAGGIAPFYPLGERIGFYLVHFRNWIKVDLILVPMTILLVFANRRWLPNLLDWGRSQYGASDRRPQCGE